MRAARSLRTSTRVAWRLDRWPLAAVAGLGLGCAVLALLAAARLNELAGPTCGPPPLSNCGSSSEFIAFAEEAGRLSFIIGLLPFIAGILLGAPLAARELERRTAAVTWGLSASRLGWLAWRASPVVALLAVVLVALALGGARLSGAREPLRAVDLSFVDHGQGGLILATRGLAAFAVALAAGVYLQRVLPALLIAVGFSVVVGFASQATMTVGLEPEEVVGRGPCIEFGCGDYYTAYRGPDGAIVDPSDVLALAGADGVVGGYMSDAFDAWAMAHGYTEIDVAISGERYPDVERRDALVTLVIGVGALASAVVGLRRATVD
jgi:hypothetical protein